MKKASSPSAGAARSEIPLPMAAGISRRCRNAVEYPSDATQLHDFPLLVDGRPTAASFGGSRSARRGAGTNSSAERSMLHRVIVWRGHKCFVWVKGTAEDCRFID
jgi:hypothetical protein